MFTVTCIYVCITVSHTNHYGVEMPCLDQHIQFGLTSSAVLSDQLIRELREWKMEGFKLIHVNGGIQTYCHD